MLKKDIESRNDLERLVRHFYRNIRKNAHINYYFNDTIRDWDRHIQRFTDFWQSNLFSARCYKGTTLKAHVSMDNRTDNNLRKSHFDLWLNIWTDAVDELYEGQVANLAKKRANCMAQMMCTKLMSVRESQFERAY